MAVFYRAVSLAEYLDILECGELRACPASVEGKHLVSQLRHAVPFAELLYRPGEHTIIRIEVDDLVAARFFHFSNLDGVGLAWFAELPDLKGAVVTEVAP